MHDFRPHRCPLVGKYSLRRSVEAKTETCKAGGASERENLMFGCSGESEFNLVTRCRRLESDEPEVPSQHFDEFVGEEGKQMDTLFRTGTYMDRQMDVPIQLCRYTD